MNSALRLVGATGNGGQHVVREALTEGYTVRTIDLDTTGAEVLVAPARPGPGAARSCRSDPSRRTC